MKHLRYLFLACFILCSCSGYAFAQGSDGGVTLAWNANSESDLAGYKIHIGLTSGNYDTVIDVENVIRHTVTGLTVGETYFFALTAYDNWNNESLHSVEVTTTAKDIVVPEQPTGFQEVTTSVNNLLRGGSDVANE